MVENDKIDPFAQYYISGEPDKAQKAHAWKTAIGLQKVDNLQTSEYLLKTAQDNIEGRIDIAEAKQLIDSYYKQDRAKGEQVQTEEGDKVATRITEILGEESFVFSPAQYLSIHQRLFTGVYSHAGKIRDYNITKKEWVLNGASVTYGGALELNATLDYDFRTEKEFSYKGLSMSEIVGHLASFISRLWQIHVFGEGNTRTTAVFLIKYLRSLGFNVTNDLFADNSWYFRNALVRANYNDLQNDIHETTVFLEKFLRNLLLGEDNELKNRYLHIDWQKKTTHSETKRHIERHIEKEKDLLTLLNENKVTAKTKNNIISLHKTFGIEKIFGRSDVVSVLGLTEKPASTLIKKMVDLRLVESVRGLGKGKYRFVVREV
ncbi:Fic family protein [uncultured Anaerovibrio sp.]|uniref:Fic family protein n=1 Tax=uncultured Anaerovibrio sp. TaxID=361586 RepID=UPI0025F3DE11|nr:Fic family protein [uncultured Anaerovibrio sp.]